MSEDLPDDALACRGGARTAARFEAGSGVVRAAFGTLSGVSVNCAAGKTLRELTSSIPNRRIGATKVGAIRRAGGEVSPARTRAIPSIVLWTAFRRRRPTRCSRPLRPTRTESSEMPELTSEDIRGLRALTERLTPGPWTSFVEGRDHQSGSSFLRTGVDDIELIGALDADQDFIAKARETLPQLLDEVERLRAKLAARTAAE